MSATLTMNGTGTVAKGTEIYTKGESVQSVALILKGRVQATADGAKAVLGAGTFLGMYDLEAGTHSFTYTALDDVAVFGLPVENYEQGRLLFEEKPQYRGLLVASTNFFIRDLNKTAKKLEAAVKEIGEFVENSYESYVSLVHKSGLRAETISSVERLKQQDRNDFTLSELGKYYVECSTVPAETQKQFFAGSSYVAEKHFQEQCKVLPELTDACHYYTEWLIRYLRTMVQDEKNLFFIIGKMALSMKQAGHADANLERLLDDMLNKINDTESLLIEEVGITPDLNRERMEEVYYALLADDTGSLDAYDEESLDMLNGSLAQILDYADVEEEMAKEFKEGVDEFLSLTDKFARTPVATAIRKKISKHFFDIYEAVVLKSFRDSHLPVAVQLFLRVGYVSEELLTEKELRVLLSMPRIDNDRLDCKVYTMAEWLRAIYEGRKNPSKDEFDTDYEAQLRQEVAQGKLDAKGQKRAWEDSEARVHFEIHKMFKYADRLIQGNISTFVPVLCSEGIYTKMENAIVTGAAVNTAVNHVERADYSIFYRERMMSYEQLEISRFMVTERQTPDFILFPVYGRVGMMWQDMEGRTRNSHARIFLPSILEISLDNEVLRLLSHFRWEKCRTEMGAQWNNLRYPSLTSEYTDYLQFYKKNSSLSPERKEKVKAQLTQCNNRHRDVFAKDYQDWVQKEAAGAAKLNRVAREILFTYCPFGQEIANVLLEQNAYQEAGRRYVTEKRKTEKSIGVIIHKFEKNGKDVPLEIIQTKKYLIDT